MKNKDPKENRPSELPQCAADFIELLIARMRYRKAVRAEVRTELTSHFEDALKDCKTDDEKQQNAQRLIEDFGDPKLLAVLLRRAKKRCRPLWRTAIARTFQTAAVLLLCFIVYVAWFLTGKPNISTDYVAVFNQMSRPEISDKDNAWPHYEKTIDLFVQPNEQLTQIENFNTYSRSRHAGFESLNDSEKAAIQKWTSQNQAAWREFAAASSKPYCFREYRLGENNKNKWVMGILLPNLRELKDLGNLGIWRSRIQAAHRQPQQALQTALAVARAARHWQRKVTLLEQLIGIGLSRVAHEQILSILATESISADDLTKFQRQLSEAYPDQYPLMNIQGEKLFLLDTIQQVFTDGGPGGGHLIPGRFMHAFATAKDEDEHEKSVLPYVALGLIHAGRDETTAKANQVYEGLLRLSKMSPYQKHHTDIADEADVILALPEYRYALIRYFLPALGRACELGYRSRALHQATITVLALQRWRAQKKHYPQNLTELKEAGFLKQAPIDPYSDKPLVYKKTDDGFVLYSLGQDFKDDGGNLNRDGRGKLGRWPDEGDAVFWPLKKKNSPRRDN